MEQRKPYSYLFVLYYNTCFQSHFRMGEEFINAMKDIQQNTCSHSGMLTRSDLEELRFDGIVDRAELEHQLIPKLYSEMEILDTPHMVRKILLAHNILLYVAKENYPYVHKPEAVIPSQIFLTSENMYNTFQNNNYQFFTASHNKHKCYIEVDPIDFTNALHAYRFRIPVGGERELYYKSRKFAAIHAIIETNMLPYFKAKHPKAFEHAAHTDSLIKEIQGMYQIEFTEHAKEIVIELRRLNELSE